jgi:hypothetical protein
VIVKREARPKGAGNGTKVIPRIAKVRNPTMSRVTVTAVLPRGRRMVVVSMLELGGASIVRSRIKLVKVKIQNRGTKW